MSRPTGVIIAPPKPWITRIAISIGKLGASPHKRRAAGEDQHRRAEHPRAPKRSAIQPLTGMNTARLNR